MFGESNSGPRLITRAGRGLEPEQIQAATHDARRLGLLPASKTWDLTPGDLFQIALQVDPDLQQRVKQLQIQPREMGPKKPGPRKGAKYRYSHRRNQNTGPSLDLDQLQAAATLAAQVGTAAAAAQFGMSAGGLYKACHHRGVELHSLRGGRVHKVKM